MLMHKGEILDCLYRIKSYMLYQHVLSGMDKQYVDMHVNALDIAIRRIEKDISEWHACCEEMPEDDGWYIFIDSHFATQTARFKYDAMNHFWPKPPIFDLDKAVAWHELPSIDVFKKLVEKRREKGGRRK